MLKFLAGCHYNEEEISRHLIDQILKKPVEVVKGRILVGWAQKSPKPCILHGDIKRFRGRWIRAGQPSKKKIKIYLTRP